MKVALYARVSTSGGRQDSENQLLELRQWASRLGGQIVKEYVDEASGSNGDRKAFKTMLQDAHRKEFDVLLIWALDRLSREGIARMSAYLDELKGKGVRILSHQEPWLDTGGPVADLLIAIFGWVAQQERNRISERVKLGLKRAKISGKKLGRPQKWKMDRVLLKALKGQGRTIREIGQELNVSPATVCRYLQMV